MKTLKLLATLFIFASALVSCKCFKNKEVMANLENTTWSLVKTAEKNFIKNEQNPEGISISFKDGNFSTSNGCNAIGGEYKTDASTISFDKVISTMRFCDQEFMKKNGYPVEFHLAHKFKIKEDKLYLYQEDGKTLVAEYIKK